jgi:hypothetical protein
MRGTNGGAVAMLPPPSWEGPPGRPWFSGTNRIPQLVASSGRPVAFFKTGWSVPVPLGCIKAWAFALGCRACTGVQFGIIFS